MEKLTPEQIKDIKRRIVGALALDIREYWGENVGTRLAIIEDLSEGAEYSTNGMYKAYEDGRWFRDSWDGPYGCTVTEEELGYFGLDKDIFESCMKSWREW